MPTPIGHSLMGGICYSAGNHRKFKWQTFLLFIFLANLPDFDYLPGAFLGTPNMFHRGISHSIGFAILLGGVVGFIWKLRSKRNYWRLLAICTGVILSHVLLDYIGADTGYPYGVPLFWPLTNEYFIAPLVIFSDLYKGMTTSSFLSGTLDIHNFYTILREVLILLPVWGATFLGRKLLKAKKSQLVQA